MHQKQSEIGKPWRDAQPLKKTGNKYRVAIAVPRSIFSSNTTGGFLEWKIDGDRAVIDEWLRGAIVEIAESLATESRT